MNSLSKKHFLKVLFFILYNGDIMQVNLNEINSNNIIDIRSEYEFNQKNISGSINIPKMNLLRNPEKYLNKFDTYYLVCSKGYTSLSVSKILNALGYNCYSINGGIDYNIRNS